MFALLAVLIPLVQAFNLPVLQVALGLLTASQWLTVAADLARAEPVVVAALMASNPAVAKFVADVRNGVEHNVAVRELCNALRADRTPTIPGRAGDGSVIAVPNPDKAS